LCEEDGQGYSCEERKVQGGACGGAKGFGREGIGGAALAGGSCHCGGGTEGGGGSNDGAYVAGILHASENYDEWCGIVCGGAGDIVESECARSYQCSYALGIFGVSDAFEEAVGGEQDWDGDFGTIEILREAGAVAFTRFAEEYGADGRGRVEGFFDEAWTFDAYCARFGGQAAAESDAKFF